MPSPEEIETLRRLILANEEVLTGLGEQDRQRVQDAITTARRSRATLDATFPAQFRGLARRGRTSREGLMSRHEGRAALPGSAVGGKPARQDGCAQP